MYQSFLTTFAVSCAPLVAAAAVYATYKIKEAAREECRRQGEEQHAASMATAASKLKAHERIAQAAHEIADAMTVDIHEAVGDYEVERPRKLKAALEVATTKDVIELAGAIKVKDEEIQEVVLASEGLRDRILEIRETKRQVVQDIESMTTQIVTVQCRNDEMVKSLRKDLAGLRDDVARWSYKIAPFLSATHPAVAGALP
ncbi:hypothetical protein Poli38472_012729 [Pythium oligandrum]|uniref:Uncharacterized protein n=1 Tax=Pythium oligandrum TaxID=41045 RepID=A0A8K1CFD5_PYTOL|nr:hypothetical protein Poli38472_012729 [Pythium oligandrum]|eukprot:TMW61538.1 hypothetical protein Poli38472_012729 [Pythium oligandrum]